MSEGPNIQGLIPYREKLGVPWFDLPPNERLTLDTPARQKSAFIEAMGLEAWTPDSESPALFGLDRSGGIRRKPHTRWQRFKRWIIFWR